MSSERRTLQLDEICEFVNGFAFKPTSYVPKSVDTYEVFRMGYISRGGGFKEDNSPVFVQKTHPKLDKYFLRYGDIVIAMTDMKDKVAILANTARVTHNNRFVLNQRAGLIRVKRPDLVCPTYLYYYTNWAPHVDYLRSRANSGVQVNLSTSAIKEAEIELPPIFEQKAIGQILLVLDDRIALLRETNATLEAIAQALFKSWFIDFDPVHARARGEEPAGLAPEVAALFPASFEESELGIVPKGWRVGTLADLSDLNPESWTSRTHPESVRYVDLANTKDNVIAEVTEFSFEEAPSRARRVLRDGDTIVGTVRPGNRSFAFISNASANLTGSTGFAVLRPRHDRNTEFVFLAATSDNSIDHLAHVADGGAYPAVRSEVVSGLSCVVPDGDVLCAFHEVAQPIFNKVAANHQQAQTLATLRDTLLPRLISGQLRLPEAESLVEATL
ncbi:TPA: restriction endonuclease subunit S [Aeromonas hydrophila]|nr:restriction endonuclease subunit S [Aeromonas hydrophila]HAT2382313.1 restriction endonuclease subunit S [Aeromonas hydrophila]HAT2415058.1 restriction endonuclease subunit S [Aeromonas hydrophila]HAT2525394.1 restriction endonuclease subunit S [Aeromonas hydrophila]HAT2545364.1 restriction endonuclease subunit S [Aeromonas hydrophila]